MNTFQQGGDGSERPTDGSMSPGIHIRPNPWRLVPPLELLRRIAETTDADPWRNFFEGRWLFQIPNGAAARFGEYAQWLCFGPLARATIGSNTIQCEVAFDILQDRFTNLPASRSERCGRERGGPDRRLYFAAIVRAVDEWLTRHPNASPQSVEAATAQQAQRVVTFQALRAFCEASRRTNPARSRYQTKVDGRSVTVWFPRRINGRRRREVLLELASRRELDRGDINDDLQKALDERFGASAIQRLEGLDALPSARIASPLEWLVEHEVTSQGMVQFLANEKAVRWKELRRGIARLGPDGVRRLVVRVLEARTQRGVTDKAIANEFSISLATYCRFAGRHSFPVDQNGRNPDHQTSDLARNIAEVLGSHPEFRQLARAARVWEVVRALRGAGRGRTTTARPEGASLTSLLLRALTTGTPGTDLRGFFSIITRGGTELDSYSDCWEVLCLLGEAERWAEAGPSACLVEAALTMTFERCTLATCPEPTESGGVSPWKARYEQFAPALIQAAIRPAGLDLILLRDNAPVARCAFESAAFPHSVLHAQPGLYELTTDTGWVLWTAELGAAELRLDAARPERPLRLAAASKESQSQPTASVRVESAGLIVSVFPGVESGTVRIEWSASAAEGGDGA